MNQTLLRRLYFALAFVVLAPLWIAPYIPTCDGPSHVYNSWVIGELLRGNERIAEWYAIDWHPNPNWTGHAVLTLLMTIFSPRVAEKLLASGIVLLFLYAVWLYAGTVDESRRWLAFVAFPLAYNLPFQVGFYNFAIGLALYFIVISVWWKRRGDPSWKTITLIGGLLLLTYFSHPLPAMLAIISIGILWFTSGLGQAFQPASQGADWKVRAKRHLRHLLALLPPIALLAWFFRTQGTATLPSHWDASGLFSYIMRMWSIVTMDREQERFGFVLFAILFLSMIVTFIRRRWTWSEADGFIFVTLAVIFAYSRSPLATSGGTMILERLAVFVILSPLVWLEPKLPRRVIAVIVIALSLAAVANTVYLAKRYRLLSGSIAELLRSGNAIGRETSFVVLGHNPTPQGTFVPVLGHAIDYLAVARRDIDVGNYEAMTTYFPIRIRPGKPAVGYDIGKDGIDLGTYAREVPYLFMWHIEDSTPVMNDVGNQYDLIATAGEGRVYHVKPK